MRKRFSFIGGLLLAVALHGQDYSNLDQTGNRSSGNYQSSTQSQNSRTGTQVRRLNKASNLIGSEVRDQSNERVGEVKDVVIDFTSGRVAYVVVDASDVLEGDRTCIAVPARVIRLNQSQNALTIDADRNRIEQLRAFTGDNYPRIRGQSTQMTNWRNQQGRSRSQNSYQNRYSYNTQGSNRAYQTRSDNSDGDWYYYEWYLVPSGSEQSSSGNYADNSNYEDQGYQGTYGQSQSGRAQQSSGDYADSQESGNVERYSDQWDDQSTAGQASGQSSQSNRATSSNAQSSKSSSAKHLSGRIRSVDQNDRTLTVESQNKTVNLRVADNASIKHNGTENVDLSDLEPGQRVDVTYNYRNGANRAVTINQHTQGAATTSSATSNSAGSSE